LHLDDGLRDQITAVVVEGKVVDRVDHDLRLHLFGKLGGRDDVQPPLGFLEDFLPVHL
jgi:hypothetical protein